MGTGKTGRCKGGGWAAGALEETSLNTSTLSELTPPPQRRGERHVGLPSPGGAILLEAPFLALRNMAETGFGKEPGRYSENNTGTAVLAVKIVKRIYPIGKYLLP